MMKSFFVFGFFLLSLSAYADQPYPCLDFQNRPIQNNDDQIIRWKQSTQSGYKDRGNITGRLVKIVLERPTHIQIDVDLSDRNSPSDLGDHIEVIYNKQFGVAENFPVGADVQACGDFINSSQQNGPYPPSPMGAILHWVHMSPDEGRHPSGFLIINGQLMGQTDPQDRGGNNPGKPKPNLFKPARHLFEGLGF